MDKHSFKTVTIKVNIRNFRNCMHYFNQLDILSEDEMRDADVLVGKSINWMYSKFHTCAVSIERQNNGSMINLRVPEYRDPIICIKLSQVGTTESKGFVIENRTVKDSHQAWTMLSSEVSRRMTSRM